MARFNKCPNPSAANNTTGYLGTGTRTQITGLSGSGLPRTTGVSVATGSGSFSASLGSAPVTGVTQGQTWTAVGWIRSSVTRSIRIALVARNGTGGSAVSVTQSDQTLTAGVWTQVRRTGTLPSGINIVHLHLDLPTTGTAGTLAMSSVRLEQVNDATLTYADGDTAGWQWDGTPGNSASQEVPYETKRFYLTNTAAAYVRGAASTIWHESTAAKATPFRLGTEPAGSSAARSYTETAPGSFWVALGQFMSGPASVAGEINGDIRLTVGRQESDAAANVDMSASVWVLKPDGGLRGFVFNTGWIAEFSTAPTATTLTSASAVTAFEAGDRLIVEVGFAAENTATTPYTASIWHGGTGTPDLADGATDLNRPAWIELVVTAGVTFAADLPTVNAGADVPSHLAGAQFTRTAAEGYGGAAITDRSWTIEAGPSGVGTEIGTAAALTWTPTVVGQYTLRCSATNSAGTGFDEITVNVAAPVGVSDTAVEGLAVGARNVVGAWPDVSDVLVEAAPVTLTKYIDLEEPSAVGVEATAAKVAHLVHAALSDIVVEGLPIEVFGKLAPGDIVVQGPPIQVSYSSRGTGGLGGIRAVPDAPTTRFIVQSILTGQFLHWDLPIVNPTVTLTLSGPTTITGDLEPEDPEIRDLLAAGLEPWACWIHVETDGLIRASGILQPFQIDDEVLSVEAMGPSSYLHGIPYLAELSGIQIDPADVVRAIWAHVQSYPDGNLGVTVNGTTPIRIGEPAYTTPKLDADGNPERDEDGNIIMEDVEAEPYQLVWWEGTDCGSEVDNLAQEAPFDYIERCAWNADRTAVNHWIDLGYPRLGARRDDLRFATGENVTGAVPAEETDDLYASQVVLYGKGEGRDTIRGYAGRPLRKRLRRVAIIQDSTIATAERAAAISADDLERRQGLVDVTDLEVEARHLNAQFGTYAPGDDILIDVEVGWLGRLRQYERILSVTYAPDGEAVRLQLRRAEAFRYGGGA